jgi:hypothetical protein
MPSPGRVGFSRRRASARLFGNATEVARRLKPTLPVLLAITAMHAFAAGPILVIGDEPGAWRKIFGAVGLSVTQATSLPPAAMRAQVEAGAFLIVEGESEFASALGIRAGSKKVPTRSVVDTHNPKLSIIWERSLDVPQYTVPARAQVFAKERWTGTPLVAGLREGQGAVLWLAVRPGANGYERFPYLLHAVRTLGLEMRLRSNRLWAFLDTSYRTRVDIDYIADRWSRTGISALHVAAWHFNEPDEQRDSWLRTLIAACHKRGILVYAWIELPHVSEQFWDKHPEWREKTAVLQDAHLDWRKLMNLASRDCAREVERHTRELLARFDWDGVNLAELYFESLEGAANPARFTPMNDDVRAEYKALTDVDPVSLFTPAAPEGALKPFLDYRAELARRLQSEWLGILDSVRASRPWLDITLTHVDDRFDSRMPELIGADSARTLPLLQKHDFTFLIEDPATVWHLGPDRYKAIAEKYAPLTPRQDRLAIDLNIVERYQDVYPTKQQTGTELFQLVNTAANAFERVALYFETSLLKPDVDLLSGAAAAVTRFERAGERVVIDSKRGAGVLWSGPVLVDGRPWPAAGDDTVWLPAGAHVIEPGTVAPPLRLKRLNGDLRSASAAGDGMEFAYSATARALATLSARPASIEVDGHPYEPQWFGEDTLVLPRGQHIVKLRLTQHQ